jgi:hypothetical protein
MIPINTIIKISRNIFFKNMINQHQLWTYLACSECYFLINRFAHDIWLKLNLLQKTRLGQFNIFTTMGTKSNPDHKQNMHSNNYFPIEHNTLNLLWCDNATIVNVMVKIQAEHNVESVVVMTDVSNEE